jgi:endonuclease/exonuclease/phosphatase (EEP) superfamily protein YafD
MRTQNSPKLLLQFRQGLFFASTVINVSNGKNTSFWEARWLNGVPPKELASNLYKQAHFKSRTVHKELSNMNWVKNQVNTEDLIKEFVLLFNTVSEIQLNENADTMFWRWTTSGEYTAASAYEAQFLGAYPMFRASSIWRAHTEPKC